jgi:uncharacterized membrane protein YphA (DoxX/SURF4 family)
MARMLRHLARLLLGAAYVQQGIEQLRRPEGAAEAARPYVRRAAGVSPLPDDPALVVRTGGAALVAGGLGLATNTAPRLAATLIALVAVPVALLRHPVTGLATLRGPEGTRLLGELGLFGGVLLAVLDTEGRPGLAWRARHGTERVAAGTRRQARSAQRTARREARAARWRVRAARHEARAAAHEAVRSADGVVRDAAARLAAATPAGGR